MVKYAPDKDKPHIRECFNSIPKQLAKENKKFQYSKVKPGGRGETYLGSLQWLEDAGIICRCYNTDITGLPMEGNAKDNVFKVSRLISACSSRCWAPGPGRISCRATWEDSKALSSRI